MRDDPMYQYMGEYKWDERVACDNMARLRWEPAGAVDNDGAFGEGGGEVDREWGVDEEGFEGEVVIPADQLRRSA